MLTIAATRRNLITGSKNTFAAIDTSGSDSNTTGEVSTGDEPPTTGEPTTDGESTYVSGGDSDNPGLEEGMYDNACGCRSDGAGGGSLMLLAGLLLLGGRRRR